METATLSSRTINIDGMTGDACVKKVTTALAGVENIKTDSVKVGAATIHADDDGCTAACGAIDSAGYTSHCQNATDAAPKSGTMGKVDGNKSQMKPATQSGPGAKGVGDHADHSKAVNGNPANPAQKTPQTSSTPPRKM